MDISSFSVVGGPAPTPVAAPAANAPAPPGVAPPEAPVAPEAPVEAQAPADVAAPTSVDTVDSVDTTDDDTEASETAEPTPEPVKVEPEPAPEKPVKVDPRFSALARKEAQLHREREALKAERAAVVQAQEMLAQLNAARDNAKRDPVAALAALGLTVQEVAEFVANGNKPTPQGEAAAVRAELERFREEQRQAAEDAAREREAAEAAEHRAVLDRFSREAIEHVEKNPDRYELTTIHGGATLVPKVVEQHFARTGKLLSTAQAAELVEKHFEQLADRVAKARKLQARSDATGQGKAAATSKPAASTPAPAPTTRTLSNALTASTSTPTAKARTDDDRIRAALARLSGN